MGSWSLPVSRLADTAVQWYPLKVLQMRELASNEFVICIRMCTKEIKTKC